MHPHNEHRQHKVEKRRVAHLTKGYATGGSVHSDEPEDKALIKKMVRRKALKAEGAKPKHRADRPNRASGGRVKKGKGTNVTVVVAPQQHDGQGAMPHMPPAMPPPPPAMASPPPPMHPPMMPPPGAMPPGMPPGGPPGMMPRKSGGRATYAKGGAVKSGPGWTESEKTKTPVQHAPGKDDQDGLNRGRQITYAEGGRVKRARGGPIYSAEKGQMGPKMDAGAGGGLGRLEKMKRAK